MPTDKATYHAWIEQFDTLGPDELAAARRFMQTLERRPKFDVIMCVYDPPEQFLAEAIASIRRQVYENWTLCIADDCSTRPYVRRLLEQAQSADHRIKLTRTSQNGGFAAAANAALALGSSEFVAFLDHDDVLADHALLLMAHCLEQAPDANIVHTDGDILDELGERASPYFKPEYDHELLLSHNLVWCGAFRRRVLEKIGGMRQGFAGSEDYDLSLRVVEQCPEATIRHVPHVLYRWRMVPTSSSHTRFPTAIDSAQRAVEEHCCRIGVPSAVSATPRVLAMNRVRAVWPTAPGVTLAVEGEAEAAQEDPVRARYASHTDYEALAFADDVAWGRASIGAFRNEVVRRATTELIAFIDARLLPRNRDWLTEMASHFAYATCAAVAARIIGADGRVEQSGVLVGVREPGNRFPVARALHGAAEADTGYWGRAEQAHQTSVATGGALVVRRSAVLELGGFDEAIDDPFAVDVDFCMRARDRGRTLVTCPYAVFDATSPAKWFEEGASTAKLIERWGARLETDPYYNPNLTNVATDFGLAFPPRARFPWRT